MGVEQSGPVTRHATARPPLAASSSLSLELARRAAYRARCWESAWLSGDGEARGGARGAANGTVAVFATDGGNELDLGVDELMSRNIRYQFVLVYTVPPEVKNQAVTDVAAAAADGALPVGDDAGLPLHRFPLDRTADA